MRKIAKKRITQEFVFESEDGTHFPFEGLATEHDIEVAKKNIEPLKRGDINIPDLNLVGSIYKVVGESDLEEIRKYCETIDMDLDQDEIPTVVIITDKFAVSIDKLKELSESISNL